MFRSGASELTIAVAANGNRIVVGWNDGEGFGFRPFQPVDPQYLGGAAQGDRRFDQLVRGNAD